jgi:hypothetical protein
MKCWKIFGLENIFFCHLGMGLLKELRYDVMFNDLMHCRLHEPLTPEKRTRTLKMTLTNMRTVVVIKQVQHDQDKETTIIIFEEDMHDLQKTKYSPPPQNLISISTTLPRRQIWNQYHQSRTLASRILPIR